MTITSVRTLTLCTKPGHHFAQYCQENLFEFHRDPNVKIHLFNQKQQDIYELFKENIIGGPSIIYYRNHEAGKTFIHNNPNKPCQKIIGYDANVLYLHALSMDLPTQIPLIRREENEFKKEFPGISEGCRDYLDWTAHDRNIKI